MAIGIKWIFFWLMVPGLLFKPVLSDGGITITMNAAIVTFPEFIKFQLDASSAAVIQNVTLVYGTDLLTCQSSTSRHRLDFEKDKQVSVEWKMEFTRSGAIPPGVEIWWQWEITDTSGNLTQTEKKSITVQDERFQ